MAAILAGSENLTAEVEKLQPDVILIDTESPSRDTLENLAAMNKNMPRPVVIFTQEDGQATIRDAVRADEDVVFESGESGWLRGRCGVAGGVDNRAGGRASPPIARASRGCPHRLEERRGSRGLLDAMGGAPFFTTHTARAAGP